MRYLTTLIFICLALVSEAQVTSSNGTTQTFDKQYTLGGNLHTRGWGINFKYGKRIKENKFRILDFEFAKMKHAKEVRVVNPAFENPKPYVFGKKNATFFLRTGIGRKIQLTDKLYKNSITAHFNYLSGLSTGILKPIYLDIYNRSIDDPTGFLVPERYNPEIHTDQSVIYGNSAFSYGLDELSFRIGGYIKTSFSFEWGDYQDEIRSIELGMVLDAFPNNVPIMAFVDQQRVFTTFFASFQFGSKW